MIKKRDQDKQLKMLMQAAEEGEEAKGGESGSPKRGSPTKAPRTGREAADKSITREEGYGSQEEGLSPRQ